MALKGTVSSLFYKLIEAHHDPIKVEILIGGCTTSEHLGRRVYCKEAKVTWKRTTGSDLRKIKGTREIKQ